MYGIIWYFTYSSRTKMDSYVFFLQGCTLNKELALTHLHNYKRIWKYLVREARILGNFFYEKTKSSFQWEWEKQKRRICWLLLLIIFSSSASPFYFNVKYNLKRKYKGWIFNSSGIAGKIPCNKTKENHLYLIPHVKYISTLIPRMSK